MPDTLQKNKSHLKPQLKTKLGTEQSKVVGKNEVDEKNCGLPHSFIIYPQFFQLAITFIRTAVVLTG